MPWLFGISMVAAALVLSGSLVGLYLPLTEKIFQMDANSGRTRTISRGLFKPTVETLGETWMSEALNSAAKSNAIPLWVTISRERHMILQHSIACKTGLPLLSELSGFRDRFSAEAYATIAKDLLGLRFSPPGSGERWRAYEGKLLQAAAKVPPGALIGVETVAKIRERVFASDEGGAATDIP